MAYVGSWKIDDLLTFYVNTHTASTGAVTDGDSAPTYRVYEDETGTPILTGTMALLDDANTVGLYSEQITLSAANGFEKGKSYCIRVLATVATVSGAKIDTFQIEAEVDANRQNWANVDNPTSTIGLSNTTIGTVTTYTGNTPQTGDSYAIVSSGVHGNAAIKGYVDDIGVAGAGLTAIPWNATWDAEVQSEVVDALNVDTYGEPTGVPGATVSLVEKIGRLYMALRNALRITTAKKQFYDDAGNVEWEKDLSDDGTNYDETEANAP